MIHDRRDEGFTLIELSIVLVIIGLIVGGILVGQDMIKAAEIRATIAQVEKLDAAVNTFRDKFGGRPGDLLNPTNYNLTARTSNGDGAITGCTAAGGGTETKITFGCEDKFFWNDLSAANLVPETFSDTSGATSGTLSAISGAFNAYVEQAKTGDYIIVWANGTGQNYIHLRGVISVDGSGAFTFTPDMTPLVAMQIDQKMDDGTPGSGSVLARDDTDGSDTLTGTACASGGVYNVAGAAGNIPSCELRIAASF